MHDAGLEMEIVGAEKEHLHLLLSCILATKPVRGICGVSWGMGGGGGAIDTESQQREGKEKNRETKRVSVSHRECADDSSEIHPTPSRETNTHIYNLTDEFLI